MFMWSEQSVFTRICTCQDLNDIFAMKIKLHKICYTLYVSVRRNFGNSADHPSTKISQEILENAFDKLIVEISFHPPLSKCFIDWEIGYTYWNTGSWCRQSRREITTNW